MARHGKRLFLLGAKPGVAELAAANLKDAHPGLIVCGTHDGYFREDGPVVEEIRAAAADVVFVCLGAPKQELWMVEHGPATGAHLMVGLGGSLDVFAGVVERAPEGFQKVGAGVALPPGQGTEAHRTHGQAASGAGPGGGRPAAGK